MGVTPQHFTHEAEWDLWVQICAYRKRFRLLTNSRGEDWGELPTDPGPKPNGMIPTEK